MRRNLWFLILSAVIAIFSANAFGEGENLLSNPSFETGTYDRNTIPEGWWGYTSSDFWETTGSAEGAAIDGEKFEFLDPGNNGYSSTHISQNLLADTIDPAKEYYFSVMAKDSPTVEGTGTLDFWVVWYDVPDGTQYEWSTDIPEVEPLITTTTEWERYTIGPYTPPSWAATAIPRLYSYDASDTYYTGRTTGVLIDDVYFGTDPSGSAPVHTPDPADGSSASPGITTLSWQRDQDCTETIKCELWWGIQNDPNFWSQSPVKVMALSDVSTFNLADAIGGPITLEPDEDYYWALRYEDPNDCLFEYLSEGPVWSFSTRNSPPVVDAGLNQSAWLSGVSTASVSLSGSATDDDLPNPPGTITYHWLPVAGVSLLDDTDPATTATFTSAGTYTLTLEAKDDAGNVSGGLGKIGTDTVEIYVYNEAYTGLIANWQFENNYADSTGGHTGTPQGDPQFVSDAVQGSYSLEFDGSGDYVDCGGGTIDPGSPTWASPLNPNLMTVTCWIKSNGFLDEWGNPVSKSGDWQLSQAGSSDDVEFEVTSFGTITSADGSAIPKVDDGQWHHIAGVLAGDAIYLYVDGVFAGLQNGGPAGHGGHDLWIGKGYYPAYPEYACEFNGKIDDVKLYNCPLSHDKVIAEYKAGGGANSCGGKYALADVNQDCYVTLADFAEVADKWLWCNDLGNADCD